MAYEVIISELAENQADAFINYLVVQKKNPQAAKNLIDDIKDTKDSLSITANALGFCKDSDLKALGYKIIFFRRHRYLWIYQINGMRAEVKAMYHQLQDYEKIFKTEDF